MDFRIIENLIFVHAKFLFSAKRVKSGNFGPEGFSAPLPISFMGFMCTSYDYQSND